MFKVRLDEKEIFSGDIIIIKGSFYAVIYNVNNDDFDLISDNFKIIDKEHVDYESFKSGDYCYSGRVISTLDKNVYSREID